MELLSCDCKNKCESSTCTCIDMSMRCTDLCELQSMRQLRKQQRS